MPSTTRYHELDEKSLFALIDASISDNNKALYTLLIFTGYCGFTALSISDIEFFIEGRDVSLPILSVSISTWYFVTFAPIMISLLYALHYYYVDRLRDLLNVAHDNYTTESFFLLLKVPAHIRWLCTHKELLNISSGLSVAAFPLVIIGMLWWRSLVLHDVLLSGFIAIWVSICASGVFLLFIRSSWRLRWDVQKTFVLLCFSIMTTTSVVATFVLTQTRFSVSAELDRARFSEISRDYASPYYGLLRETLPEGKFEQQWVKSRNVARDLRRRLDGMSFRNASLRWSDFVGLDLTNADFRNAELFRASLEAVEAENASFEGANLSNVSFYNALLRSANLRNTVIFSANFHGAFLERSSFRGAILYGTRFDDAILREADFGPGPWPADLRRASFSGANAWGANLREARMSEAFLRNADLREADFEGAILDNALLWGADLSNAKNLKPEQLRDAFLDQATKLPPEAGFADIPRQSCGRLLAHVGDPRPLWWLDEVRIECQRGPTAGATATAPADQ